MSPFDWMRLEQRSIEAQAKRDAELEAKQLAIRDRERQRAFWALEAAMCRVERYIGNPHEMNLPAIKGYRDALKRAANSLKD